MAVTVTNTTASLTGKTLLKAEDAQTITGQKTFNIGASSPFLVNVGALKVDNLDADKLDGEEGTAFHDAALLTGNVAVARLNSGTGATVLTFWRGDGTWGEPSGLDMLQIEALS